MLTVCDVIYELDVVNLKLYRVLRKNSYKIKSKNKIGQGAGNDGKQETAK